VIGIVGKTRVIDPLDLRMLPQIFGDAARILDVPLDPQRDRFDALQQQKGGERRQHRGGALIDAAAACDIGSVAEVRAIRCATMRSAKRSAGSGTAERTPAVGNLKAIPAPPIPSEEFLRDVSKPATPGIAPAT